MADRPIPRIPAVPANLLQGPVIIVRRAVHLAKFRNVYGLEALTADQAATRDVRISDVSDSDSDPGWTAAQVEPRA